MNKLAKYMNNFMKFRPLLSELVVRDIKVKYRRSVLGVLWTLLNPLFMMTILSVVFSNIFKFDVENFPLYVLSGQVIFNFFNDSTTMSLSAIINNSSLIKKIYVPKYLFVLSRVVSGVINLMAAFTALLLVMTATRAELHWEVFLSIIPMAMVVVFSLGVGLLLAAVTVRFRDIQHLYTVFTTGLMYLTPVIYPMSMLPSRIRFIVMLNPLTNYLLMFRDLVMNETIPSAGSFALGAAEMVIALALGVYVFYKNQDSFILNI